MKNIWILLLITSAVFACTTAANTDETQSAEISDDSLMTLIQYRTFQYFWDGAEPTSGAARERFHTDDVYPLGLVHTWRAKRIVLALVARQTMDNESRHTRIQ